jgi:hypothetical protein
MTDKHKKNKPQDHDLNNTNHQYFVNTYGYPGGNGPSRDSDDDKKDSDDAPSTPSQNSAPAAPDNDAD